MRDTPRITFRRAAWALAALVAALAFVGRARTYWRLDPQLRAPLLRFRVPSMTPGIVRVLRRRERPLPPPTGVSFEVRHVPVGGGARLSASACTVHWAASATRPPSCGSTVAGT